MLQRFPDILTGCNPNVVIRSGEIPYAFLTLEKQQGKKTVFLTEHTLLFVTKGQKVMYFKDEVITVNPQEIVLMKRGIYVMSERIPEDGSFEALTIFIPDSFFLRYYPALSLPKQSDENIPSYTVISSNEILNSFQLHYKSYFGSNLPGLNHILDIKLQELFLLLTATDHSSQVQRFIASITSEQQPDIEYVVQQHLLLPVTIQDLARLSGRSIATFKRDFEKKYHTTPRHWINQQRLSHAQRLLTSSEMNVAEIAFACGYENVSHFIRIFRNEFNTTPAGFRKVQEHA